MKNKQKIGLKSAEKLSIDFGTYYGVRETKIRLAKKEWLW